MAQLSKESFSKAINEMLERNPPAVIFARDLKPSEKFIEIARKHHIPVLGTDKITSNIAFYNESSKEIHSFGLKDFEIADDVSSVICPNGIKSTEYKETFSSNKKYRRFKIDQLICEKCKFKEQCLTKNKAGEIKVKSKFVMVPERYDAVLNDSRRVATEEFRLAYNKRYKIERRFATMVRNHGLRRCRYIRLNRAKIHITLANMASNIVRMIKFLWNPSTAVPII